MRHSFFDKYADRSSPIHDLPVRGKIFGFLVLLICYAFVPVSPGLFLGNAATLIALFLIAGIPLGFVFRRVLVILPFLVFIVVFIPLFQGSSWLMAGETLARAGSSVLALILFISTTRFHRLLEELEQLGVPDLIIRVLAFIYRYFFVLIGHLERMQRAVRARSPRGKRRLLYRGLSRMLGMLIIRTYEQSERVYQAMKMRGYDGEED